MAAFLFTGVLEEGVRPRLKGRISADLQAIVVGVVSAVLLVVGTVGLPVAVISVATSAHHDWTGTVFFAVWVVFAYVFAWQVWTAFARGSRELVCALDEALGGWPLTFGPVDGPLVILGLRSRTP